ncbi:ABC transporter ATP-binding protein [uncultured Paraglaciecola sp.]|uniref:ABC transporter ATP-binding protein n=1 Tax=uncultured Paraglaciecola sp. TaxID=1765024 RepID=UPI00262FC9CD|nr:ABC transporter ATP-binding protein [uncultured Paraglaciecola sp.]
MATITLKGLAHSYQAKPEAPQDYAIQALDHVWQQGGAYALLGPSGCGKSTLLNIISGLLTPSEGQVLFDEKVVNDLSPEQRNIAQVFQFPVVYDAMTVAENLAFPLKNIKMPKGQIQQKVQEIAELLELTDSLHKKAQNLSADQKQKVSMARGLVREDVSAILFDEPLTVIDPNLKWKLRRKLKQIHEQLNITMLYVTHDQLEAATFADEIALMYQGKIVQFGTPQELFERPNHTFVGYFIGSPGMNFIPVEKHQSGVSYQNINIPINAQQQLALQNSRSSNLKLGIRPEFVALSDTASPHSFAATLESVEHLGSYQLVSVVFAGLKMQVRVSEKMQFKGQELHLSFPSQWLKLYIDEYLVAEPAPQAQGHNHE